MIELGLRRRGAKVILGVNKAEGAAGDSGALEAWSLGLGEPVRLSAEHGEGIDDLYRILLPLREEFAVFHGLQRILILQLCEHQGEEILLAQRVGRGGAGGGNAGGGSRCDRTGGAGADGDGAMSGGVLASGAVAFWKARISAMPSSATTRARSSKAGAIPPPPSSPAPPAR